MNVQSVLACFLISCISFCSIAQTNTIKIKAKLNLEKDELNIEQTTVFYNKTNTSFSSIYLHNWANSFADNETPLAKRFLEDYSSDFEFAKKEEKGFTVIDKLTINNIDTYYQEVINHPDVLKVEVYPSLKPKDSIVISANYTVKIPSDRFTGFGKKSSGYHLRFWYLAPAVYQNDWQTMSNLNMDDLYMDVANYEIEIDVPKKYYLESNLYHYTTEKDNFNELYLTGKKQKDIIISLDTVKKYEAFKTKHFLVKTDLLEENLDHRVAKDIIQRELNFIEDYLGKYPNPQLFVDWNSVGKNSLHDIYGLPEWLKPFPENFKWEMRFFKALTIKYIDDVLLLNRRKDYWLTDGIQTFLMMEYVKKYYSDVTILGKYSKWWLLRDYNIAKLKQNDKYPFVYQFSTRRFFDQPLNTSADSLSNFNRKTVSKYKAGLGFRYLQDFVGDSILKSSFKEFYHSNLLKPTSSREFQKILTAKTNKNLDWFFGDYVKTDKKIDYKIKKVVQHKDSLEITIKNKRSFTAPVSLYGVKDKKIKFKTWVTGVDSTKTVKIPRKDFDKLALNYEQLYPEYNSLNNFRKVNNSILRKPLQFRLFKDINDPYYTQLFINPDVKYNLYDGLILGFTLNNQPILARNFEFSLTPNYSTRSRNFTGAFSARYNQYFRDSKLYRISYGIGGSNFHYAPELSYFSFSPSVTFQFRRNSLRDVGTEYLQSRLIHIKKEVPDTAQVTEQDKYRIFNLRYVNSKPNVIKRFQYALNLELGDNFSKFSTDIRYRRELSRTNSFELRFFGGFFFHNDSEGDYFSFGLNRGSDYLFEQSLFGRSESSGLFSQQFVVADGGFKSRFRGNTFANEAIASVNTSVGVWKWLEVYNDASVLKSREFSPRYFYENGVRLNFIPNIFEFYFPIYTNEGLQFNDSYGGKIRFIITTSLDRIYNFIRRGLL